MEQVGKADPFQELRAHAFGNAVDDGGTVVGGVDMDVRRAAAMRHGDEVDDCLGDASPVGTCWSTPAYGPDR